MTLNADSTGRANALFSVLRNGVIVKQLFAVVKSFFLSGTGYQVSGFVFG